MRTSVDNSKRQAAKNSGRPSGEPGQEETRGLEGLLAHINGPADPQPRVEAQVNLSQQNEPADAISSSDDEFTPPLSGTVCGSRFWLLSEDAPTLSKDAPSLSRPLSKGPGQAAVSASWPKATSHPTRSLGAGRGSIRASTRDGSLQAHKATAPGSISASTSIRSLGEGRGSVLASTRDGSSQAYRATPPGSVRASTSKRSVGALSQPSTAARSSLVAGPGRGFVGYNWIRGAAPQPPTAAASLPSAAVSIPVFSPSLPRPLARRVPPPRYYGPPPGFPPRPSTGLPLSVISPPPWNGPKPSDHVPARSDYLQHPGVSFEQPSPTAPGPVRAWTSKRSVCAWSQPSTAARSSLVAGPGRGFVGYNWIRGAAPQPPFVAASLPSAAVSLPVFSPSPPRPLAPRALSQPSTAARSSLVAGPGRGFVGYNWIRGAAPQPPFVAASLPSAAVSIPVLSPSPPHPLAPRVLPPRYYGPPPGFPPRPSSSSA